MRAASVSALNYPRKGGKRITGTITPPSNTMKYYALTNDDEGEIYESVEDAVAALNYPRKGGKGITGYWNDHSTF